MKKLYKGILLFVLTVFAGVLILGLSLSLPKGVIHNNVFFSVDTFANEMDLPRTITGYAMTMLDNNTDAWMLLIADYHNLDEPLADQMLLGQYAVYDENRTGLVGMDSINSLQTEQILRVGEYPRYWHGWLFPLRLSLCFFNYSGIRMMNVVILTALFALTVISIERSKHRETLVPFLISFVILMPVSIPLCMAYMISTCIALTASAVLLLYQEHIDALIGAPLFFMLVGAVTAYSEFLQFPLITLGFPLVFSLAISRQSPKQDFRNAVLCAFAWGCGYFGMWIAKWLLASLFTSRNVIKDAMNQIAIRFSSTTKGQTGDDISRMEAVSKNLAILNKRPIVMLLVFSAAFYLIRFFSNRLSFRWGNRQEMAARQMAPYLLISLLPFAWVFLLANHSYIHFHFTYRVFSITVFAILCGLSVLSAHEPDINENGQKSPLRSNRRQHDQGKPAAAEQNQHTERCSAYTTRHETAGR